MALFLKLLGVVLIIGSFSALGFYKSHLLAQHERDCFDIYTSLISLKESIRLGCDEIAVALEKCFPKSVLTCENDKFLPQKSLKRCDSEKLREFLLYVGMGSAAAENERTDIYIEHFKNRYQEEKASCSKVCRLYRSLGFLCGLFLSIFII